MPIVANRLNAAAAQRWHLEDHTVVERDINDCEARVAKLPIAKLWEMIPLSGAAILRTISLKAAIRWKML